MYQTIGPVKFSSVPEDVWTRSHLVKFFNGLVFVRLWNRSLRQTSPSMALSSVGFYLLELLCVVGKNSLSRVYKPGVLYSPIHSVPSRFHLKYTEIKN